MSHKKIAALTISCILLNGISVVRADSTIFDNIGPGNTYDPGAGWAVAGPASPPGVFITAAEFAPNTNESLTQIELGLNWETGLNAAQVSIWTENSGLPGTELAAWTVTNQPITNTNHILTSIDGITGVTLTGGITYFLELSAGADTLDQWGETSTGDIGRVVYFDTGQWRIADDGAVPAFAVFGKSSSVSLPVPATTLLLLTGLAGIAVTRAAAGVRRRNYRSPVQRSAFAESVAGTR
jgi:hypothetical protein